MSITQTASAHVCTPPQTPSDYIGQLPAWDGTPRLDTWMTQVFKQSLEEHTAELEALGSLFIEDMVARTLPPLFDEDGEQVQGPGCRTAFMLLLIGPMGSMKSTALQTLAGQWFSDSNILDDYNPDMALEGTWLQEIPGIELYSRRELPKLKDFARRTHQRYRKPYTEHSAVFPRTALIAATSHAEGIDDGAHDWISSVTLTREKADIEWLSRNRDQLFAEAKSFLLRDQTQ